MIDPISATLYSLYMIARHNPWAVVVLVVLVVLVFYLLGKAMDKVGL